MQKSFLQPSQGEAKGKGGSGTQRSSGASEAKCMTLTTTFLASHTRILIPELTRGFAGHFFLTRGFETQLKSGGGRLHGLLWPSAKKPNHPALYYYFLQKKGKLQNQPRQQPMEGLRFEGGLHATWGVNLLGVLLILPLCKELTGTNKVGPIDIKRLWRIYFNSCAA